MNLNKEEISREAQEWFNVDKKHADLFAEKITKMEYQKSWYVEWIPTIVLYLFLATYLVTHW